MASMQARAMQYIGRPVTVQSTYGMHYGILHHCDGNGMYLQLMQGGAGYASHTTGDNGVVPLSALEDDGKLEEVWFPFFFVPWLAALALWPGGYLW